MTKIYNGKIKDPVTGKRTSVYRDMTEQEQKRYDETKNKEELYLSKYSNDLDALEDDLNLTLEKYNALQNEIYPLGVEIDYLRYISKVIRQARGERVEWMGSKCICGNFEPYSPVGICAPMQPLGSCINCWGSTILDFSKLKEG